MRTPLALLLCLLLTSLAVSIAHADLLPPPDDAQQVEEDANRQEPAPPGTSPDVAPPPDSTDPVPVDIPARPSWSMGVVTLLAMSVLIFVYLRRQHTLPAASSSGTQA